MFLAKPKHLSQSLVLFKYFFEDLLDDLLRSRLADDLVDLGLPGHLDLALFNVAGAGNDEWLAEVVRLMELSDGRRALVPIHEGHFAVSENQQVMLVVHRMHLLDLLLRVLSVAREVDQSQD